jgi:hypothetical protein
VDAVKSPFNRNDECGEPVMINTGSFLRPRPFMASCGLPKNHEGKCEPGSGTGTPNAENDQANDQEDEAVA